MAELRYDVTLRTVYRLHLPHGVVWEYEELVPNATATWKYPTHHSTNYVVIPIDLITAARLNLIRPGDDSGINDEQWAWLKLLGFSGENR